MNLFRMSVQAAFIILAVILIRALSINRLPKKTFIALWGVALVRLLVPFSLPSRLSAYTLASRIPAARTFSGGVGQPVLAGLAPPVQSAASALPTPAWAVSPWILVWLCGAVFCAIFFGVSYVRCKREFSASFPLENAYAAEWLCAHRTIRPIQLRQSARISAPLTYGIFRPVILMPKKIDWRDQAQLRYVLTHEIVHIRRFDAVTKLLLTLALCLHWFNPLVWAMYILSNRDMELSCDERVVRMLGKDIKSAYAMTLIRLEERKCALRPLCNSFSKNAIEERITAIMKMKRTSVAALLVALVLIAGVTTAFATSAVRIQNRLTAIPDTSFTDAEYDQLLALRFDGYQDMTVAQYQQKVWTTTDTAAYMDLLERFSHDISIYNQCYTHETASFLYDTLIPLTAERWQDWDFSGYTESADDAGNVATLEYSGIRKIENADALTVGAYEAAIAGMRDDLSALLQEESRETLADAEKMDAALQQRIAALQDKWQTPGLRFEITYHFNFEEDAAAQPEREMRGTPGSAAEYQSLLALKTPDYEQLSVAEFNLRVLEWANAEGNYDVSERIGADLGFNDLLVALTDDELAFVRSVLNYSGAENARHVQSNYTGRPEEDPILGSYSYAKDVSSVEPGYSAWCNLDYWLTYHIVDKTKLTVGARDACIAGVTSQIEAFWDRTAIDELLLMDKAALEAQLHSIADQHSTEDMTITLQDVFYERQDERRAQG